MEDYFSESFSLYYLWPVNYFSIAQFERCWVEKPETKALKDFGAHQSRCHSLHTFNLEKNDLKKSSLKNSHRKPGLFFFFSNHSHRLKTQIRSQKQSETVSLLLEGTVFVKVHVYLEDLGLAATSPFWNVAQQGILVFRDLNYCLLNLQGIKLRIYYETLLWQVCT